MESMIEYIFEFIVTYGVQTDEYTWDFRGTEAALIDEGFTIVITWGPRLKVIYYESVGEVNFEYGSYEDLEILYNGINSFEYSNE